MVTPIYRPLADGFPQRVTERMRSRSEFFRQGKPYRSGSQTRLEDEKNVSLPFLLVV